MELASTFRGALTVVVVATIGAGATPAGAAIIASDSFNVPSYAAGPLGGQTVGGTGFTGAWSTILTQSLDVDAAGFVDRPLPNGSNAGNQAAFAAPIAFGSGQIYISYDINNITGVELTASRIDLNASNGGVAFLGASIGIQTDFDFGMTPLFGTGSALTGIDSLGAHRLVGVLDFDNNQIAMFVDPTGSSFYDPSNGNTNADGLGTWTPSGPLSLTSYNLVNNLSDRATFDNVVFANDGGSVGIAAAAVPEPSTFALVGVGLGVGGLVQWRRRRSAKSGA